MHLFPLPASQLSWCETRAVVHVSLQQFRDQSLTEVFWQVGRYPRQFILLQLLFIVWNKSGSKRLFENGERDRDNGSYCTERSRNFSQEQSLYSFSLLLVWKHLGCSYYLWTSLMSSSSCKGSTCPAFRCIVITGCTVHLVKSWGGGNELYRETVATAESVSEITKENLIQIEIATNKEQTTEPVW